MLDDHRDRVCNCYYYSLRDRGADPACRACSFERIIPVNQLIQFHIDFQLTYELGVTNREVYQGTDQFVIYNREGRHGIEAELIIRTCQRPSPDLLQLVSMS